MLYIKFVKRLIIACLYACVMDHMQKIHHTIDAQFGPYSHGVFSSSGVMIEHSKRTGRIRGIRDADGNLLGTLRPDGGLAVSIRLAQMMLEKRRRAFEQYCIEVSSEAAPFVSQGRSLFCKHVVKCGKNVRAGSDVPVTYDGSVIAVGKAQLACVVINDMNRGVAVKIRDSLKSRNGGIISR